MPEPPSNWRSTGIQKVSKQLKEASKGLAALTSDLAHGGLATRLNGGGRAPDGARGTPYSPWLAQPFLKVRPAAAMTTCHTCPAFIYWMKLCPFHVDMFLTLTTPDMWGRGHYLSHHVIQSTVGLAAIMSGCV